MSLPESFLRVQPACVAISMVDTTAEHVQFRIFGSGVCIDSAGVVVTARHVVDSYYLETVGTPPVPGSVPAPDFSVVFTQRGPGEYHVWYSPVSHIAYSERYDLALLQVLPSPTGWPAIVMPARDKPVSIPEGMQVATIGYPLRNTTNQNVFPHLCAGVISSVSARFEGDCTVVDSFDVDISVHPGNSGGPLFDAESGELLGIVVSQMLRDVNVAKLLSDSAETVGGGSPSLQVWTNLAQCVPVTAIPAQSDFLAQGLMWS